MGCSARKIPRKAACDMLSPSTGAWEAAIASACSSKARSPADKSNRGAMSFAGIGFSYRFGSDAGSSGGGCGTTRCIVVNCSGMPT